MGGNSAAVISEAAEVESDIVAPESATFRSDATVVLSALRVALCDAMSDLGSVGKPADLQRLLKLDQTLSWQLFKIVNSSDVLSSGSVVPSRTSMERFLKAARSRGVDSKKIRQVLATYARFENVLDTHAGDRVTFNSMVSAAAGLDEEWQTTDLQHRRNMFRGLSHVMGLRAKTRLHLTIVRDDPERLVADYASITGMVDLRILRDFPRVRIYGMQMIGVQQASMTRRPLGDSTDAQGYLLTEFSTKPLGAMSVSEKRAGDGSRFEAFLESPRVGNVGSKTAMFAELMQNYPYALKDERAWGVVVSRPFEIVLNDMLIMPGSYAGLTPRPDIQWDEGDGNPADGVHVEGNFVVEHLGRGPDAMATPDVPNYPAMVRAAMNPLGWDLSHAEAYRLRVEFPLYRTNISMRWGRSDAAT